MHNTHFDFAGNKFKISVKEDAGKTLAQAVLKQRAWIEFLSGAPYAVSNKSDKVIYVAPEFRV